MILDAILLSVIKMFPYRKPDHEVAIMPDMRLGEENGVRIVNPASQYEMWLTGNVDYGVIQYRADEDIRGLFSSSKCGHLY